MDYKDYYAVLGVDRSADAAAVKRAYRRLARKYHPDVSSEPQAEERFKEVAEAHEVLSDPEKRAAYDRIGERWQERAPPPDWDAGFEFGATPPGAARTANEASFSEFFEALFGAHGAFARGGDAHGGRHHSAARAAAPARGEDHHAKVLVPLEAAFRGSQETVVLQAPEHDTKGRLRWRERRLDVQIPRGVRGGQLLRLAGQGGPGEGGGPAGDLYLEVDFAPHRLFAADGRDVSFVLPVAPWEAALGTAVEVVSPAGGRIELRVPPGAAAGQRLRLKGQGIPGEPPGDLYARIALVLPKPEREAQRSAYQALRAAFPDFDPRLAHDGG
jgi:curved DNA-binding protein